MQADDALVPLAHQTEKEVDHRQHVGQAGGDAGAHRPQAQELGQDEQRVQHQVGDAAHGHAEGGLSRLPSARMRLASRVFRMVAGPPITTAHLA